MKREIPLLFRQLAMASRAGLPLPEELRIAAASCREGPLRRAVESVERSVRAGHPLAKSLARYPQQFDEVEVALVAVGEEQGELDQVLTRLADRSERAYHARKRLVFALLYPALLFLAALDRK